MPMWWQPCLDWGQDHGSCTAQAAGGSCEAWGAHWDAGLGGGWSWGPCVLRGVFHETAIKALCKRGWCRRVRVLAVTLWVRGMLCGMLHGCAEMLRGSSEMQLWQNKFGGR